MIRSLLLAVMFLAACGAPAAESVDETAEPSVAQQPTPEPTPSLEPTASPSPSPTPFDTAALGAEYLAIVEAGNVVRCAQNAAINGPDFAAARQAWMTGADATRDQADSIRGLEFPPDLQQAQEDMLRALSAVERSSRALGASATVEEYNLLIDQNIDDQSEAASLSNFLRGELGLESTPGAC